MNGALSHEPWEELAVGYALAALEPEDEQRFLAHLPNCPTCRQTVAQADGVLAQLAYAAEPANPPHQLLERLRATVGQSGTAGGDREPHSAAGRVLHRRRSHRVGRRPGEGGLASRLRTRGAALAFAALVTIGGLAGWNVALHNDVASQDTRASRVDDLLRSMAKPGAAKVALDEPQTGATKGFAVLDGQHVWLVLDGLAANNPAASTYVLWQKNAAGNAAALGSFDAAGGTQVVDIGTMHPQPGGVAALAITKEHGRAIPAQPGTPVAAGPVSQ